jgi:hypothetical protein
MPVLLLCRVFYPVFFVMMKESALRMNTLRKSEELTTV